MNGRLSDVFDLESQIPITPHHVVTAARVVDNRAASRADADNILAALGISRDGSAEFRLVETQ